MVPAFWFSEAYVRQRAKSCISTACRDAIGVSTAVATVQLSSREASRATRAALLMLTVRHRKLPGSNGEARNMTAPSRLLQ